MHVTEMATREINTTGCDRLPESSQNTHMNDSGESQKEATDTKVRTAEEHLAVEAELKTLHHSWGSIQKMARDRRVAFLCCCPKHQEDIIMGMKKMTKTESMGFGNAIL